MVKTVIYLKFHNNLFIWDVIYYVELLCWVQPLWFMVWSRGCVKLLDMFVNRWIWGLPFPCCKIDWISHICWCCAFVVAASMKKSISQSRLWPGWDDWCETSKVKKQANTPQPPSQTTSRPLYSTYIRLKMYCTWTWSAFIQLDWKYPVNMPKTCCSWLVQKCALVMRDCLSVPRHWKVNEFNSFLAVTENRVSWGATCTTSHFY